MDERVLKTHDSQEKPHKGKTDVAPLYKQEFLELADRRYRIGIERYGYPLQTFNGRNAGLDAMEEWFDLGIYLKQLRLEHASALASMALVTKFLQDKGLVEEYQNFQRDFIENNHREKQDGLPNQSDSVGG